MQKRINTNRVIFHHSLSNKFNVKLGITWHKARGFSTIGYHYVVLKTGEIEQGRGTSFIGAHCKGRNADSVGVCFEGDFRKYEPNVKQIEGAGGLFHQLCRAYNKALIIEFHRNVKNPCPGIKLDRDDFNEILARYNPYYEV